MSRITKLITGSILPVTYRLPINESAVDVRQVIKQDKIIPGGMTICPHCNQEILEKHCYHKEDVDYHSDCGGAIQFPLPDEDTLQHLEKTLGMSFNRQTRKWSRVERP